MKRTAEDDETAAADKMAEKVANRNQIFVRRRCRRCANTTGGFTDSNESVRRTCHAIVREGIGECGGDMEEIWRGKL